MLAQHNISLIKAFPKTSNKNKTLEKSETML